MKDYYYLLGLKPSATLDEIKDSYRRLAKKFHPDLNGGDKFFAERFKDINEAYEVLSDYSRRKSYDTSLEVSNNNPYLDKETKTKKNYRHNTELKQESLNFLTRNHNPNCFEFKFRDNLGDEIAAEYNIEQISGKISVYIASEYANEKTIIKICGITALIFGPNESLSIKIKDVYDSIFMKLFHRVDLGWKSEIDSVDNHFEGIILNDLCNIAIVNGKISAPKSDSLSGVFLWSKALKTGVKSILNSRLERNEIPKWLYYAFLELGITAVPFKNSYSTKFFGRCNRIQIKSDLN